MSKKQNIDMSEITTEDSVPKNPKSKTKQFKAKANRNSSLTYTIGEYMKQNNINV